MGTIETVNLKREGTVNEKYMDQIVKHVHERWYGDNFMATNCGRAAKNSEGWDEKKSEFIIVLPTFREDDCTEISNWWIERLRNREKTFFNSELFFWDFGYLVVCSFLGKPKTKERGKSYESFPGTLVFKAAVKGGTINVDIKPSYGTA